MLARYCTRTQTNVLSTATRTAVVQRWAKRRAGSRSPSSTGGSRSGPSGHITVPSSSSARTCAKKSGRRPRGRRRVTPSHVPPPRPNSPNGFSASEPTRPRPATRIRPRCCSGVSSPPSVDQRKASADALLQRVIGVLVLPGYRVVVGNLFFEPDLIALAVELLPHARRGLRTEIGQGLLADGHHLARDLTPGRRRRRC